MALTDLKTLINATSQNLSQFKGLSVAYGILLGGTPTIDGYTSLINTNNTTNFGAGGTTQFNDENIYINTINALYQGNATAKTAFDSIVSSAATIQDALNAVYNYVVPTAARTQEGLDSFKSKAGFYALRAAELKIAGTNGTALVAFAALSKIVVDSDIGGLGDTINDLVAAVGNGSAAIPQSGTTFTPLETADGTQFDADDVGGGANQGKIFTLTNNVDGPGAVAPALDTNGTIQDDTYIGTFGSAQGDFIDGKAGNDTLKLVGAGTATVALTSVERVEGNATGGAATFNVAGSTGIKTLAASGGSSDLTFTGLASLADTLEITNQAAGNVTVTYNAATVAGTADSQKVVLNGFGLATAAAGNIGLNGIETAAFTATGVNRFGSITSGGALKTVTVEGAGSFRTSDTTGLEASVKSFDASTATGNVRIGIAAGGEVAVKTGTGTDRIQFNAAGDYTTKDSIDAGTQAAGTFDTLVLTNEADLSAATNETLKALNTNTKGIEALQFNGGSVILNHTTLTNTEITKFIFDGAGNDTVNNAGTATYAATKDNAGSITFTLGGSNTTLNLALEGQAKSATLPYDDADFANVNTGSALTVNVLSTGVNDPINIKGTLNTADFNSLGTVTAAANATFKVTGDGATSATFANAVNYQGGDSTGQQWIWGSNSADIIVGGSAGGSYRGQNGIDSIDITKSAAAIDVVDLTGIVASANRDTVAGFKATGAAIDVIQVNAGDTTNAAAAGTAAGLQEVNSNTGTYVFNTAANDVIEFAFNLSGTGLAGSTDGTALLAAVGSNLTVSANGDTGYIVAYQAGNAYLYYANAGADNALAAAEIQLVGTFSGVAVGELGVANFQLV